MRKFLILAAGAALLAAPAAASAQSWGSGDYYHGGYGGYGSYFSGYPQFRDAERHIRMEIREGQREGWLDQNDASDFSSRLNWIRKSEQREFNEHGWNLPSWDQQRIRQSLDQLDRSIDSARDDDAGNGGGWSYQR